MPVLRLAALPARADAAKKVTMVIIGTVGRPPSRSLREIRLAALRQAARQHFARLLDGERLLLGEGTHLDSDEVAELSTLLEELEQDELPNRLRLLVDSSSWWPPPDRDEWALQEARDLIDFVRERAACGDHIVVVVD